MSVCGVVYVPLCMYIIHIGMHKYLQQEKLIIRKLYSYRH